jgi:cytochrome c oxidase assembly protein subunit 15
VRAAHLRPWAALGLVLLVTQIALGGWVSTNYAALACIDLPTCHGEWMPQMDFRHGFQLLRELGQTAAGDKLSYHALTAIHWTHRVGAVVVTLYLAALLLMAWRTRELRGIATALGAALSLQVVLGVSNILTGLKLPVAVAHNAGAALLLVILVVLNFALSVRSRW